VTGWVWPGLIARPSSSDGSGVSPTARAGVRACARVRNTHIRDSATTTHMVAPRVWGRHGGGGGERSAAERRELYIYRGGGSAGGGCIYIVTHTHKYREGNWGHTK
jgi:hypothetical protein